MITFRTATSDDVAEVVALVESAYRGEASRSGWTTEADLLDGQRVDEPMVAEAIGRDRTHVLLMHRDGDLVGCCELTHTDPGVAELGMFAVDPDSQGDGLGRQILEEAERVVERFGATRLELSVIDLRAELMAWYERRGFVRTGRHVAFPYGDDRFGRPLRDDLRFEIMSKDVTARVDPIA